MLIRLPNDFGFTISTSNKLRKDAFLFGESQGRAIVSVKVEDVDKLKSQLDAMSVPYMEIGTVNNNADFIVNGESLGSLKAYKNRFENGLDRHL